MREDRQQGRSSQLLAAIAALALAGCAGMRTSDAGIVGIGDVSKNQEVDVVLIHGMGASGIDWAVDANTKLAEATHRTFDEAAFRGQEPVYLNGDKTEVYSGVLNLTGHPPVHTYAIVWSAAVTPWKRTLCYDASEVINGVCEIPAVHGRALLNSQLKSDLLDTRLSDVVFYVAEGQAIVPGVVEALQRILDGDVASPVKEHGLARMSARQVPVFFMSESLGSKILLDSLLVIFGDPPLPIARVSTDVAGTLSRFGAFFMAANQVAILSPRAIGSSTDERCPKHDVLSHRARADCRIAQLAALLKQRKEMRFPVRIVAFSDPNDLLSWKLEPYFAQLCREGYAFCDLGVVDIEVGNAFSWFGLFENPIPAHTGYWKQRDVKRILDHGKTNE